MKSPTDDDVREKLLLIEKVLGEAITDLSFLFDDDDEVDGVEWPDSVVEQMDDAVYHLGEGFGFLQDALGILDHERRLKDGKA